MKFEWFSATDIFFLLDRCDGDMMFVNSVEGKVEMVKAWLATKTRKLIKNLKILTGAIKETKETTTIQSMQTWTFVGLQILCLLLDI